MSKPLVEQSGFAHRQQAGARTRRHPDHAHGGKVREAEPEVGYSRDCDCVPSDQQV